MTAPMINHLGLTRLKVFLKRRLNAPLMGTALAGVAVEPFGGRGQTGMGKWGQDGGPETNGFDLG